MIYSSNQSCQLYVMKNFVFIHITFFFFLRIIHITWYRVYLLGAITSKNNTNNNNFIFDRCYSIFFSKFMIKTAQNMNLLLLIINK